MTYWKSVSEYAEYFLSHTAECEELIFFIEHVHPFNKTAFMHGYTACLKALVNLEQLNEKKN